MIKALKYRLSHVNTDSLRYRFARTPVKEGDLRKAHACTFYWVYLPAAAIHFVLIPALNVIAWLVSRPIAWLAGYRRVGPLLPFDINAYDETMPDAYVNAHVKIAPWRIVLPLLAVAGVLALASLNTTVLTVELVVLGAVLIGVVVGWLAWQHWAKVTDTWDRICPRLEVEEHR